MEPIELEICHSTRYAFSKPVFLEPHLLRFQPRSDGSQRLLDFQLDVDPLPAGMSSGLDAAGNVTTQAWFDGLHSELCITARSVLQMFRENPFDFLVDGAGARLPVAYGLEMEALRPYIVRRPAAGETSDEVAVFAARMSASARGELLPFLSSLNRTINDRFRTIRREEGECWSPARTWREQQGACRDLANLFIEVCRILGVAARFVSGYEDSSECALSPELHAWAEVYIPGAGWRAYDPSRGIAAAQHHVTVAAAAKSAGAAPVSGSYRGDAQSTLDSDIRVERRSAALAPSFAG